MTAGQWEARQFCAQAIAYLKVEYPDPDNSAIVLEEDDAPVNREFAPGLFIAYLVDVGESFSYVQGRDLREAGMTLDELYLIGIENLKTFADEHAQVVAYGDVFAVFAGGNFEASFLLLDDFWSERCAHLVTSDFVVAIPARDILAFGNADSAVVIRQLNEICHQDGELDHPLTNTLYRRIDGCWHPMLG